MHLRMTHCPASGTRYVFLQGSAGQYLSCKRGTAGLYVRGTERLAIAAVYQEPITLQQCAACVDNLCQYLASRGF